MHLADAFIQSDLQYIHLLSVHVFPGNRTHNLCAANAMLYHWAKGTLCLFVCFSVNKYLHLDQTPVYTACSLTVPWHRHSVNKKSGSAVCTFFWTLEFEVMKLICIIAQFICKTGCIFFLSQDHHKNKCKRSALNCIGSGLIVYFKSCVKKMYM